MRCQGTEKGIVHISIQMEFVLARNRAGPINSSIVGGLDPRPIYRDLPTTSMAPKSPKSAKTKKGKGILDEPASSNLLVVAPKSPKAPKEKRAASAYNVFMKNEIDRLKKSNPNMTAKERFKAAALNVFLVTIGRSD